MTSLRIQTTSFGKDSEQRRTNRTTACVSPSSEASTPAMYIVHIRITLRQSFRWKAAAVSKTTLDRSEPASQQANINEDVYILSTTRLHSTPSHPAQYNTTHPPETKRSQHASPPLAQALQAQTTRKQSPPPGEREEAHHRARRLQPLERNGFGQRLDQTHRSTGSVAREHRHRAAAPDEVHDCRRAQAQQDSS